MFKKLSEILKCIEGNVLVIGLDDSLLSCLDKNNKINLYSISRNDKLGLFKKSNKMVNNRGKSINIKKLRKYIKSKSINYLIINFDEIIDYYKYIIKDTINISNNKIYIYASNSIDKNFIISRYKRYKVNINILEYKNGYLITLDNNDTKNNIIKDILFFIKDTFYNIAELIGNILAS